MNDSRIRKKVDTVVQNGIFFKRYFENCKCWKMAETKICFDRLNDSNWATWRYRMELMLMKEDLWSTVKNDKPESAEITSAWTRKDEKARAMIGLALEDNQLVHIMEALSAQEMWEKLKGYHERGSLSNKIHVLRRLCSMRLVEGGNLSDHLMEASELVYRLARMGESLKEHLVVAILLSSLPDSYDPLVTALEGRPEEDLKLDYVKGKLMDEWRRKNVNQIPETEKVMKSFVQVENPRNVQVCHHCKQEGHFWRSCPVLMEEMHVKGRRQDEIKSVTVQRLSLDSDTSDRRVCFTAKGSGNVLNVNRWIMDTGSTMHMTGSTKSFTRRVPCNVNIKLADGRMVIASERGPGSIVGRGPDGNSVQIKLKELFYVPGLTENVLSVSQVTNGGYSVVFGPKNFRIMDDCNVIAVGEKSDGLYFL